MTDPRSRAQAALRSSELRELRGLAWTAADDTVLDGLLGGEPSVNAVLMRASSHSVSAPAACL